MGLADCAQRHRPECRCLGWGGLRLDAEVGENLPAARVGKHRGVRVPAHELTDPADIEVIGMLVSDDHGREVVQGQEVAGEGPWINENAHVRGVDEKAGMTEVGEQHPSTVAAFAALRNQAPTVGG